MIIIATVWTGLAGQVFIVVIKVVDGNDAAIVISFIENGKDGIQIEGLVTIRSIGILKVPKIYLMPIVAALSIVGAYAINNRAFDIIVCLVFGVLGYILDKMEYSPAPIVLGIILGNMIDENFRRALIVSDGSLSIFVTRPISLIFLVIIVITIVRMVLKKKPAALEAAAMKEE